MSPTVYTVAELVIAILKIKVRHTILDIALDIIFFREIERERERGIQEDEDAEIKKVFVVSV